MKKGTLWAVLWAIALTGALCAGCGRQPETNAGTEAELRAALEEMQQRIDALEAEKSAETEAAEDTGNGINTVLDIIESQPDFKNDWLEPLAAVGDFNGDGVRELLALYESGKEGGSVVYEFWSLYPSEPERITSGTLYQEVGGNGGTVSIARYDDTAYLVLLRSVPEEDQFNNYYTIIPMEREESALGNGELGMESHGTYGEGDRGEYIIGATQVSMEEFEARLEEFSNRVFIMDIFMGAEDVGVMTFDDLRS